MTFQNAALLVVIAAAGACFRTPQIETSSGDVVSTRPVTANRIPAGTMMTARLNQTLGTKSSRVGDRFTATITDGIISQNGETVVPSGAIIVGHVTGLHEGSIGGSGAVIRLAFDDLTIDGRRYPFEASISSVDASGQSAGSTGSTVRSATVGAAAGAVLGAIISGGDLDKIITGGLLGAAAGTVISLGRGDVESVLREGSTLTIRSTQSVALR
jgi:hypothetical protein